MGGAAFNLGAEALAGQTDMVTVFDDFNHVIPSVAFGVATGDAATNPFEDCGWVLSDYGTPAADTVGMNDVATVANTFNSCLSINPGTTADTGGNMQLDLINADLASGANHLTTNSGRYNFPHMWIPETGAGATCLDSTIWTFACRLGFMSSAAAGWDGKVFIGWAEAGDTAITTAATGVVTITSGGPLVGFHIGEDGAINGISHRTVATAITEGTNSTILAAATAADNATASVITWWDLALRMEITDMSDDAANGGTTFFHKRVPSVTGRPGRTGGHLGGEAGHWTQHPTVLTNQTPNNDVALVPTIEVANGPTNDVDLFVDWWAFGCSRTSR
jgi:hypothetical protein